MTKHSNSSDSDSRSRSRSRSSHHGHNRHSHHHRHSSNSRKHDITSKKWDHSEYKELEEDNRNENMSYQPMVNNQNNFYPPPQNVPIPYQPFIQSQPIIQIPPPAPPPPQLIPITPPQASVIPIKNTSPTLVVDNMPNNWKYEEVIQFFLCFGKLSGILLKYDFDHRFNGCVLVKYDKLNQSNYFSIKMNNFIIFNQNKNEDDCVLEISELKSDKFTPEPISDNIKLPVTNVIRIENLITKEILNNITDFNDFMIDLKEECENYGKVLKYVIPRNKEQGGYGYIFIHYVNSESAKSAFESLDKTEANGNIVNIMYYPLYLFEKEIYGCNLFNT